VNANQLSKLKKISRVSKIFLPLLHINRVLLSIVVFMFFSFIIISPTAETATTNLLINYLKGKGNINLGMVSDGMFTITDKCMVLFITGLLCFFLMLGLNALIKLFNCFKTSEVFSQTTSSQVKRIAIIYSMYFFVFKFGAQAITLGWFGWRELSVSLVFSSYFLLGIVWLGVWIMQVGEALYSENKMTI
jgi:hypothetical protein